MKIFEENLKETDDRIRKLITKKLIKESVKVVRNKNFMLSLFDFECEKYAIGLEMPFNHKSTLNIYYQAKEEAGRKINKENLIVICSVDFWELFPVNKTAEECLDILIGTVIRASKETSSSAQKSAQKMRKKLRAEMHRIIFHGVVVTDWALLRSKKS